MVGALANAVKQGWISEEEAAPDSLENFLCHSGRRFYRIKTIEMRAACEKKRVRLQMKGDKIPLQVCSPDGKVVVVPFRAGQPVHSIAWVGTED